MEFWISRAMQISLMNYPQLERLHFREMDKGYCFLNSEIQVIFNLPPIKSAYGIPNEPEAQRAHADRLRAELLANKLLAHEGDGRVCALNVEETHSFDQMIFHKRELVTWAYMGPTSTRRKSKTLSEIEEGELVSD